MRRNWIGVRVNLTERAALKEAADKSSTTVTAKVRDLVFRALEGEQISAELADVSAKLDALAGAVLNLKSEAAAASEQAANQVFEKRLVPALNQLHESLAGKRAGQKND